MSTHPNHLGVRFLLVVLGTLLAADAVADEDLELARPGGRARAMGQAFTAIASDLSAVHWNPAGLARNPRAVQADFRIHLGGGDPVASSDFNSPVGPVPLDDFQNKLNVTTTYYLVGTSGMLPGDASRKYGLTGSFAFRRYIDFQYSQNQVVSFDPGGDVSIPLEHLDEGTGGVDAYTFSFATAPHKTFALGVNYNLLTGNITRRDEDNVNFGGQELFVDRNDVEEKSSGHAFEIGALVTPHDMVDIGFTVRPGFDLDLTERSLDARLLVVGGAPGLEPIDFQGTFELADLVLEMPTFYSVGLALKPTENFLLAADYHYQPWDDLKTFAIVDGERTPVDTRLYATSTMAFGGEYTFRTRNMDVPLRGGYHFAPSTRAHADSLSADVGADGFRTFRGGRVERHTWSFGMGLDFETVAFDFTLERTTGKQTDFLLDQEPFPGQPIFLVELDQSLTSIYFASTLRY